MNDKDQYQSQMRDVNKQDKYVRSQVRYHLTENQNSNKNLAINLKLSMAQNEPILAHDQQEQILQQQDIMSEERKKQFTKQNYIMKPPKSKDDDIPMPLIKPGTSMMPDMKFGWKPEVKCSHPPIPLYFDFVQHSLNKYTFSEDLETSDVVVYQERRVHDSYQMHKRFANKQLQNGCTSYKFNFPKNHDGGRYNYDGLLEQIFGSNDVQANNDNDPDDFTGMNPECEKINQSIDISQEYKFLYFDADFEGGNLDLVVKDSKSNSYDVFLRPDTNTTGYFQWFYFRVKNRKRGTKCRINIVNMTKRNSLYQQGMPIMVLSLKKSNSNGSSWSFQGPSNVKYGISKLMQRNNNQAGENTFKRLYFQLGWDYTFEHNDDEVYFAYSMPYTFSMVTNFVQQIQEQQHKIIQEFHQKKKEDEFQDFKINENSFKVVETSQITTSLGGIDVPMLTITDFGHTKEEELRKKVVMITGRVHPGETNASWVVHGILKFILSKDKVAIALRKQCIFKVIPMINADGVTIGNTRCSFIGRDINRLFGTPNQKLMPEPYYIRELVKNLQKTDKHKIMAYLDVHAHSGRKSIFMYGPHFPLHCSKYMKIRTLPKLISERTEMFRFFSCKFKIEKYKENCARIAIWRDFNITNCFTIESSSFGFINKQRETIDFTSGLLQEFGECVVQSLFEYNLIQDEDRRMKMALAKKLKAARKTRKRTIAEILGDASQKNSEQKKLLYENSRIQSQHEKVSVNDQDKNVSQNLNLSKKLKQEDFVENENEINHGKQWLNQFVTSQNPNEPYDYPEQNQRPESVNQSEYNQTPVPSTGTNLQRQGSKRVIVNLQAMSPAKIPGGSTGPELNFTSALQRIGNQAQAIKNQKQDGHISDTSMDSHALAESSSSDDMVIPLSTNPKDFKSSTVLDQINKSDNVLQPRIYQQQQELLDNKGNKISQVQQMLQMKKGIDVIDADELFHQLINPDYQIWKSKVTKYVKYDQLNKKTKVQRQTNYAERNIQNVSQKNENDHSQQSQPLDKYLTKEIRTFDEVYKSIKSKVNEFDQKRKAKLKNNNLIKNSSNNLPDKQNSDNEYDDEDEEEDLIPLNEEYGNEEDFGDDYEEEQMDDYDQDIEGKDREILDNRILGIINVFSNMNQQANISQKQMKFLQELGSKSLSIEKKKEQSPQGLTEEEIQNVKKLYETQKNQDQHKQIQSSGHQGYSFVHKTNSNPMIAFGGAAPRKLPSQFRENQNKLKTYQVNQSNEQTQNIQILDAQGNQQNKQTIMFRPACNVYNIGGPTGIQVTHTVNKSQPGSNYKDQRGTSSSQIFSLDEIQFSRQQNFDKKEGIKQSKSIIPQSMTEKNHQNYKYRMALNQPVLDMKLEIKGQQAQQNNYSKTLAVGFNNIEIQNSSILKGSIYQNTSNNENRENNFNSASVNKKSINLKSSKNKKNLEMKIAPTQTSQSKRLSNQEVDCIEYAYKSFFNKNNNQQFMHKIKSNRLNSADKYASKRFNLQAIQSNQHQSSATPNCPVIIQVGSSQMQQNKGNLIDSEIAIQKIPKTSVSLQGGFQNLTQNANLAKNGQIQIISNYQSSSFSPSKINSGPNFYSNIHVVKDQLRSINDKQNLVGDMSSKTQKIIESQHNFYSQGTDQHQQMFDIQNQYVSNVQKGNNYIYSNNQPTFYQLRGENAIKNDTILYMKNQFPVQKNDKCSNQRSNIDKIIQEIEANSNQINENKLIQNKSSHQKKFKVISPVDQNLEQLNSNINQTSGNKNRHVKRNKTQTDNIEFYQIDQSINKKGQTSSQIYADFTDQFNQQIQGKLIKNQINQYKEYNQNRAIKRVTMTETKRRQLGGSSRKQKLQKQINNLKKSCSQKQIADL